MNMKTTRLLVALSAIMLIWSCQPEEYKDLGPSYKIGPGITGTWVSNRVLQIDQATPVPETFDISDFFASDPLIMSFDYNSLTYTVEDQGAMKSFFGNSGTFMNNDDNFPSAMSMFTDQGDTLMVDLTQMVRTIDTRMGFRVSRYNCGEVNVIYDYDFNRQ